MIQLCFSAHSTNRPAITLDHRPGEVKDIGRLAQSEMLMHDCGTDGQSPGIRDRNMRFFAANCRSVIHRQRKVQLRQQAAGAVFLAVLGHAVLAAGSESPQSVKAEGKLCIDGLPHNDTQYDWGGHVIVADGIHHLWWTRYAAVQGEFDTIWHATSSDGLRWRNPRKVMTPANSEHEKMHVGDPSVVKVGETFIMLYEANRRVTTQGCESQIYLATSRDGNTWKKHPNDADPRAVIDIGPSPSAEVYGIGMPSLHYRDGKFHLFYLTSLGGPDTVRYAQTRDPRHWGWWKDHEIVGYGAGFDVKYHKGTKQLIMSYAAASWLTYAPDRERTYQIHLFTSRDGRTWNGQHRPRFWRLGSEHSDATHGETFSRPRTRAFPTIASTDAHGCVDGETIRVIYMEGEMHPPEDDWKVMHPTWDLFSLTWNVLLKSTDEPVTQPARPASRPSR